MKALLLTLLTVPAFAQDVVYDFQIADIDPLLGPCELTTGAACTLYPNNPGSQWGIAGVPIELNHAYACADSGDIVVQMDATDIAFEVITFWPLTVDVVVNCEGPQPTVTSNLGTPPFVQQGVAQFTIHNEGISVIHSITVISQINTDVPEYGYPVNYPPRPQVYHEVDGRLAPYRFNRRRYP